MIWTRCRVVSKPRRAKYIGKWGEDLVHALHRLCQITQSRAQHEHVKKALAAKIEARRAHTDMPNDPWVTLADLEELTEY
jgi:hypothetical protein